MFDAINKFANQYILAPDTSKPATQPVAPSAGPQPAGDQPASASFASNEFVAKLQQVVSGRQTPFTTLQAIVAKFSMIPDPTTRVQAAMATIDGRTAADVIKAVDVHIADLSSSKTAFNAQLDSQSSSALATMKTELNACESANAATASQIEALRAQIASINEAAAARSARIIELNSQIGAEQARVAALRTQFDQALQYVVADLEAQRTMLSTTLK